MSNLSEQQFAKYSSINVPDKVYQYRTEPLPASMERHAPGEYQPTLPGMEKMLKGEQTHVDVVFKHPNVSDPEIGEPKGSNWYNLHTQYHPNVVRARKGSLHPSQDWLDDNYLNSPIDKNTLRNQGTRPKVESIGGKNVIQDGHHRAARQILAGDKTIEVDRWGGKDFL
jgi:hypothetical protein